MQISERDEGQHRRHADGAPSAPVVGAGIATHSGRLFRFLDPSPDDVSLDDIAQGLAYQCRFNGQCAAFYSVAQHSIAVAALVPRGLRAQALLHDAAEAYLGDLVRPLKAELPEFVRIEARVMRAIGQHFGVALDPLEIAVKRADMIALATERRDLMPRAREAWPELQGLAPLPKRIDPWSPADARQRFLDAARDIFGPLALQQAERRAA